jgi:hypothetical protein
MEIADCGFWNADFDDQSGIVNPKSEINKKYGNTIW